MPVVGQLKVELTAETVKFSRPVQDASRDLEALGKKAQETGTHLEKLGNRAAQIGRTLSLSVTAPLAAIGGAAVKMAMDAVESENLFEVSMGRMADAARKWSEELRQQLGLNAYEVRKQVGTFNVMFTSMGLGEQAAYGMAKGLTQLAYDMASFYNLKPEDAFLKLQAAISGAIEPLRRLGIVLTETTIEAYALKTGLMKKGEQLSETGKILARYGAIMEQTQKAQGDLARTIESPTNQLRILQSEAKQVAIDFGMALLPAFQDALKAARPLVDKVKELVAWFTALPPSAQETIVKLTALAAACGPIALALSGISKVAGLLVAGIGTLIAVGGKLAFAFGAWAGGAATLGEAIGFLAAPAGPILLTVAAIGALIAAGYALYRHWDDVKHYALQAWGYIKLAVLEAADKILAAQEKLFGWLPGIGDTISNQRKQIQAMITDEMVTITERNAKREADAVAEQTKRALLARWGAYQDLMEKATGKAPEQPEWLKELQAALSGTGLTTTGAGKGKEPWEQALEMSQKRRALFEEGLADVRNMAEFRMFEEQQIKEYFADKERELENALQQGRMNADLVLKGVIDAVDMADIKLLEYATTLNEGKRAAEQVLDKEAADAKKRWEEILDSLFFVLRDAGKRVADVLAGKAPARFGDRFMLEAEASLDDALKAVDESRRIIWEETIGRMAWDLRQMAQRAQDVLAGEGAPTSIADLKLLEYSTTREEARRAAEQGAAKYVSEVVQQSIDAAYFLLLEGTKRAEALRRGTAAPTSIADLKLLEYAASLEEGLRAAEEGYGRYVSERVKEIVDENLLAIREATRFADRLRAGKAAPRELGHLKILEYAVDIDEALDAAEEGAQRYLSERMREIIDEAFAATYEATKFAEALKRGEVAPTGIGHLKILEYQTSIAEAMRAAEEGAAKYVSERVKEIIDETFAAVYASRKYAEGILAGYQAPTSIGHLKLLEYATDLGAAMRAAEQGLERWKQEAQQATQRMIGLVDSFVSGLSAGLEDAGNAWADFMAVVVSSIKLATDDAGNIIGVDWTTTLVNIANYGLRKLGQAIGDLFGGTERLRRQYPGGAYGEVNYPDLARMRENYQNWERNFQALQQAQQAQAGMTVGGGLLGGIIGFLVGGPFGALVGAGIGAGVGYAAGQATYGKQIEDLKKKLEDTFQKIAEALGTTISDIAGALGDAFSADTYQEFLSGFATNLESVVKQGLIKAFMAGEAMRPLLQGLSDFITTAVWDGTLDAAEKLQLAQKFQEIVGVAQPFWEALQEFDFTEAVGGATDALNEFSEALRNVPTGYKIQAARWDVALPAYQEGGVVGRTGVAVLHAGETVIPAGEAGGIHVHLEGAHIYGMDDFERKVEAAVSKAARRAGLGYRGLARAGAV